MSIYNVDYDQTSLELYPSHKRRDILLQKIYSLVKPLNDLNLFFQFFREGGSFSAYSGATTYTFGQYIQYQRRIYLRNEVTTDYVAGISPLNSTYWTLILQSFIGADERVKFGPQKIIYEFALNKIFGTTFRQPPAVSDVYIENLNSSDDAFYVGELDTDTAMVAQTDQESIFFVTENDPVSDEKDYAIYVPVAVWTALAPTGTERDAIITSVANKYRLVGYTFEIITY
jgi:hypothetical protein